MTTNIDLTNRALATIGTRSQITSMTDGSTEALYANLLYAGLRDFMLREGDYDFALKSVVGVVTTPPTLPWLLSYTYPPDAIRIRQLIPFTFPSLNPTPIEWGLETSSGQRRIVTIQAVGQILYTYPAIEDLWDSIFTEAFIRLLGSSLAFALENRIEASTAKLNEALSFARIADMRDP